MSLENVVVMLTSNRPDYIDPAILRPERIDRKVKSCARTRRARRRYPGIYLHIQTCRSITRQWTKQGGVEEKARTYLIDRKTTIANLAKDA